MAFFTSGLFSLYEVESAFTNSLSARNFSSNADAALYPLDVILATLSASKLSIPTPPNSGLMKMSHIL